ncbi:histidine kinase dimerization/phospho-acceptor domain-containing protein [uncultured Enorma sp.]|uniref:histidine kinase dimerization/phospho-acceptor domain-containing protein n=1 Tax=uncultured Enorma sp. TaxID=1714346 RepID=UPI0026DAF3BB|nr:histidine kinase dimerization/phospho-acceptor domain-containing protein [uncultured Enorma sp.]
MTMRLRRFRRRVVAVSCLVTTVCAALCLGLLCGTLVQADLVDERQTLETLSNMPFSPNAESSVENGDDAVPVVVAGTPHFCRALVDAEGVVQETQGGGTNADSWSKADLAALVALRDERGSDLFWYEGRPWIGLWLPDEAEGPGGSTEVLADANDGESVYVRDETEGQSQRVYTFLDMTDYLSRSGSIVAACAGATLVLALVAGCISWIATTCALRPIAEAEKRERAFVTEASHGLKTPLMAIMANCDVLESEASDRGDMVPWIASIRAAADDMAAHIAEMLASITSDEE